IGSQDLATPDGAVVPSVKITRNPATYAAQLDAYCINGGSLGDCVQALPACWTVTYFDPIYTLYPHGKVSADGEKRQCSITSARRTQLESAANFKIYGDVYRDDDGDHVWDDPPEPPLLGFGITVWDSAMTTTQSAFKSSTDVANKGVFECQV